MLLEEYNEKETRKYLRREAWEEGVLAGMERKLIDQVCQMLRRGMEAEGIAEELEEELDVIREICQAAQEFAPDYDSRLIQKRIQKEEEIIEF